MAESDPEKVKREIESLRHKWHEHVLRDPRVRRNPCASTTSAYVRKRYRSDLGYAEFSIKALAEDMNLPERSAVRGRNLLVKFGYLVLIKKQMDQSRGWAANRYTLAWGFDEDDSKPPSEPTDTGGSTLVP